MQKPTNLTTQQWLFTTWAESSQQGFERHAEIIWFCAFMAYMIKDGFFPMGVEFILHHIMCVCLAFYFLQEDSTPAIFMLGMY